MGRRPPVRHSALFDRMACVGNCRRSRLASRVRQNSPTYTVVGQQPHDAAPEALCGPSPSSRRETLDSLSASPWPQRKNFGHPPAFAIDPPTSDGKRKPPA